MNQQTLLKDGRVLIPHVDMATAVVSRHRGLLGRTSLPAGHGLCIQSCSAIHTWFMQFPLDLIFLDSRCRAVRIVRDVSPWRIVWGGLRARSVVEMQAGWLPRDALHEGDAVTLVSSAR